MPNAIRKIAINTGGGDAPGLNAVIRAATLAALERGVEIWGISHGYRGLLDDDPNGLIKLDRDRVRGIMRLGGTILGTANRGNPFAYPTRDPATGVLEAKDRSADVVRRFRDEGFDALIAVGGDGSLRLAERLHAAGIPRVVGVPKTIDNDVRGTDETFGFDTAVSIAVDAIDRLHTTAEAHDRVMVVEVMGRNAGWIALRAGVAGGADVILLPEVPFRYEPIVDKIMDRERRGRCFSLVVVAEGATEEGGELVVKSAGDVFRGTVVLGGIAERVAAELAARTEKETRSLVLGHLQRGGGPTTYDRQLALRFGAAAVRFLVEREDSGVVAMQNGRVGMIGLDVATSGIKTVPLECDTIVAAREMGICFGDEKLGRFAG
ncbi:6-phosphofructokinase [Minicystis rosea]|nr:6-phosphofructokinase [Minicystis rosea]